jgi:hypothetical protein
VESSDTAVHGEREDARQRNVVEREGRGTREMRDSLWKEQLANDKREPAVDERQAAA